MGAAGLLYYHGAFVSVTVKEGSYGPYQFVYRSVGEGDYRQAWRVIRELEPVLDKIGVTERKPLALSTTTGALEIGYVIEGVVLNMALSDGTRVRTIASHNYMVTTTPWHSVLSLVVGNLQTRQPFSDYRAANGYQDAMSMTLLDGPALYHFQRIVSL